MKYLQTGNYNLPNKQLNRKVCVIHKNELNYIKLTNNLNRQYVFQLSTKLYGHLFTTMYDNI